VGHGPFSHALEKILIEDMDHESVSLQIVQELNNDMHGGLDTAIAIFTNRYRKIPASAGIGPAGCGVDYLNRTAFIPGSEGVIGWRIIHAYGA
jgi:HD superfamily phosphohydrolase